MQPSWGPRIFWFCVFVLVVAAVFAWFYDPMPEVERAGGTFLHESPVTISPQLIGCELQVGLGDQEPREWKGEIRLVQGKLLQAILVQSGKNASIQGGRFELSSQRIQQIVQPAILRCALQADASDSLIIVLGKEKTQLLISELIKQKTLDLFDGKVRLSRAVSVQEFPNDAASDDVLPYLARDKAQEDYLVYLNCERGKNADAAAILNSNFDSLQHPITSVSVRLSRFQQGTWSNAENVTGTLDAALDPVVAVDHSGRVYVAWSQPGTEGWDIYYRMKDFAARGEAELSWSEPKKVTDHSGSVHHLESATDAHGKVWLVWQTWHYDHYDIYAAVINDESHAWNKPGPVADHDHNTEGRWSPATAADTAGNVFIAWSVFRQGHFDIEMIKLNADAPKPTPQLLAGSLRQETKPSLVCDMQNRLWIAYEKSEDGEEKAVGQPLEPRTKIRVRLFDTNQQLHDLPPVPQPRLNREGEQGLGSCAQPHLIMLSNNRVIVSYLCQATIYYSVLQEQGWSEPQELANPSNSITLQYALAHQADHVVVYMEGLDAQGRSRLQVAAQIVPPDNVSTLPNTPVPANVLQPSKSPAWERYQETVRLFRQRPQDQELDKKHLLRGLVFLPESLEAITDPLAITRTAFEKLMCDWVLVPGKAEEPTCKHWISALRGRALTQKSERSLLSGYYRPSPRKGEPSLIIENRLDYAALPAQPQLFSLLPNQEPSMQTSVSSEMDARMLDQFLSNTQDLGFALTSDWQALATHNPPSTTVRVSDSVEGSLMPFWRPEEKVGTRRPLTALRLVAYAAGKSHESLLEAVRDRHFYLATDDIYLLARCDKRVPGEIFQTARQPVITVQVQGTGKIAKVEIWRDNKVIMSEEPPGAAAVLECPDKEIDRQWHHYMVRVIQADGEMALAQPFWIRYQP